MGKTNYLEGNIYKIDGKDQIYQVDGTFRDASIKEPPKPVDTTPAHIDPKAGVHYNAPSPTNPQGLTPEQMSKAAETKPAAQNTWQDYERNMNAPTYAFMKDGIKYNADGSLFQGVDAAGITYNPDGTRKLSAEEEIADFYDKNRPKTAEEIAAEEEKIRQGNYEQQQLAISGINQIYDNLLAQINRDNASRMGSAATINALSGQRGTPSGAAIEDTQMRKNNEIVNATNAERSAKISQIMSSYKKSISEEITAAKEARTKDANSWLAYKAGEVDRQKSHAVDLRKAFLASNMKPDEIDDKTYQEMADAGGYTVDQAKALYKSEYDKAITDFVAKEEKESAQLEKIKAETAKLKADTLAKSEDNLLINKGYTYISTPAERDAYKKQGRIVVVKNGRTYLAPTTMKTQVITRGSNNILIDSSTGEEIKDLGPARSKAGGSGSTKNYTATTIPSDLKKEILTNKAAGADIDTLMNAYSEVSTSYIQSLFAKPAALTF